MKAGRTSFAALAPYAWLAVFFLAPFVIVLKLSLSDVALAMPPFSPQLHWDRGIAGLNEFAAALDFEAYRRLVTDPLYGASYLSSLKFAAIATGILLVVGYPLAYGMARCGRRTRELLVLAVILPFCTSFLIRIYAWVAILKPTGWLNAALAPLGLGPLDILNTDTAVYIGMLYAYLPFMVLPLYAALERQDHALLEAAADLGCPPWLAFWKVTLPLSAPGMAAGGLLCFIPIVGEFVIPDLLGGSSTLMIGKTIWSEFFANRDWPAASAASVVLLATLAVPILIYQRQQLRAVGLAR